MATATGCGAKGDGGDVCGETFTCGPCLALSKRTALVDKLRAQGTTLWSALKGLHPTHSGMCFHQGAPGDIKCAHPDRYDCRAADALCLTADDFKGKVVVDADTLKRFIMSAVHVSAFKREKISKFKDRSDYGNSPSYAQYQADKESLMRAVKSHG